MELGVKEATASNRIYLKLRTGKIGQDSKEPKPGFKPAYTVNKSGVRTDFYVKEYDEIRGYITDLQWHEYNLDGGGKIEGWNVTIHTGKQEFVLQVGSKDRPFDRFMSCLLNANFDDPFRFRAWMGDRGKFLVLDQGEGNLQPAVPTKFLSQELLRRIKAKETLTDDDKRNVAYDEKGKMIGAMKYDSLTGEFEEGFPYITQNASDQSWNFAVYTAYLKQRVLDDVVPKVKAASERRGPLSTETDIEYDDDSGPIGDPFAPEGYEPPAVNDPPDDIPF